MARARDILTRLEDEPCPYLLIVLDRDGEEERTSFLNFEEASAAYDEAVAAEDGHQEVALYGLDEE